MLGCWDGGMLMRDEGRCMGDEVLLLGIGNHVLLVWILASQRQVHVTMRIDFVKDNKVFISHS